MDSKRLFSLITVGLFFFIIAFAGYRIYKDSLEQEETPTTINQTDIKDEEPASEVEEGEYVILTWVYYKNNYCTTIRLYSNGKLEQSTVSEDAVYSNNNTANYVDIGTMSDNDLTTIKNIISKMSKEELKRQNLSDGHGISVRLNPTDKILYDAEYFDQQEVNNIYNIIQKY